MGCLNEIVGAGFVCWQAHIDFYSLLQFCAFVGFIFLIHVFVIVNFTGFSNMYVGIALCLYSGAI